MNSSEHDYATYIIQRELEEEDRDESEVLLKVGEDVNADHFMLAAAEDVGNSEGTLELENYNAPNYRSEKPSASSGYWSESDVHRLLKIYIKHMKELPLLRGRPTNNVWDAIISEFDKNKRFTRYQVKTKVLRVKNTAKSIIRNGNEFNSSWPFLAAMKEILEMQKVDSSQGDAADGASGTASWNETSTLELIKLYKKYVADLRKARSPPEKKSFWILLASELGVPMYHAQLKIQSLKAMWKKCVETKHYTWPFFYAVDEAMKEDDVLPNQELEPADEGKKLVPSKNRWEPEETYSLLKVYIRELLNLKQSGEIVMKISIYAKVAKALNLSTTNVQIKITSLKSHCKKIADSHNTTSWPFYDQVSKVMQLENAIWHQMDEDVTDSDIDEDEQRHGSRKRDSDFEDGTLSRKRIANWNEEPVWFIKYRSEVQKRHDETMALRRSMLTLIEKLLDKV